MAYCAYVHGLANKWIYFLRTIPNIFDLLQPLVSAILHYFIPALVGKTVSEVEHILPTLLVHLGCMDISDPWTIANSEIAASIKVIQPLVGCILQQYGSFGPAIVDCLACDLTVISSVVYHF